MHNVLSLIDLKQYFTLGVIFCIIYSCSDVQKRDKPENLLPEQKMVNIYTDMILLDAVKRTNPKNFSTYSIKASAHIYNKYKIDSTTLADNMNYYNLDFEANTGIYKKVSESVGKHKAIIDSLVHLKDSLKKLEKNKKLEAKDSIKPDKSKKLKVKAIK